MAALEQDANGGKTPFDAPVPALHEEPGAYVPQARNCPITVLVFYSQYIRCISGIQFLWYVVISLCLQQASTAQQGPTITITYQTGWNRAFLHYNVDGKGVGILRYCLTHSFPLQVL